MSAVEIAADSEAERQFLPSPSTLAGQLLLADGGYPSTTCFDEVGQHGGSFVVRLTRSHDPWVQAARLDASDARYSRRCRCPHSSPSTWMPDGSRRCVQARLRVFGVRVVVLRGTEPSMTRLCTNLPRTPFSLDLISRLFGSAGKSSRTPLDDDAQPPVLRKQRLRHWSLPNAV